MEQLKTEMKAIVDEWITTQLLKRGDVFVIGCSTSEVAGERIGTAGSERIAAVIYEELNRLKQETGVQLAFQCCEHLNRALVVEQTTMEHFGLEQVAAVPVPTAGGSMASFAYKQLGQPVLVEQIVAGAGMDIGETMIGMHIKRVAVPIRLQQRFLGNARISAAKTRPKLIGGSRAVYTVENTTSKHCD